MSVFFVKRIGKLERFLQVFGNGCIFIGIFRKQKYMQDFVHLHVHTQYSILDGQASIPRLVDKAIADGMKGIAVTDHGDMFGIKEFFNYVNKKNGKTNGEIKDLKKRIAGLEKGKIECENPEEELAKAKEELAKAKAKLFKPIIGCEMYVARRRLYNKEGKPDQSGYHLVVLAKNEKGYHNLIKLVSKAWTEGYYMRPRTDRVELEKYHEGLIVCTACVAGEVPRKIIQGKLDEAEEAIQWYKRVFGDDFYLELQRHKATVARANHEAYDLQQIANAKLIEYSRKYGVKLVCTNDVHFVDEEKCRGTRPPDLFEYGKGFGRPEANALFQAGVDEDQGGDERTLCRCARSLGEYGRHLRPSGILQHRPRTDYAELRDSRGFRHRRRISTEIYRTGLVQ